MKLIHRALALMLPLLALAASAQQSQKFTAGKANEYGLSYTLPTTVLDVYLEAEITESTPGEFYNYARRHLAIDNAITAESRSARLLRAVIVPRGVANSDNRWLAQFKNGSNVSVTLNNDNVLLAVNADAPAPKELPAIPEARPAAPSPLSTDAARQAVTAEMTRSASVSKKAELTAQRVFELREMRSDILSGQADNPPADGRAMELVLNNLSAQEAALTAMFAGVTSTRTVVEHVVLVPDSTGISGRVIARLSAVEGLIDADNLAGAPITASVKVLERGQLPVDDKGYIKTFPKGGVAYTIPGTAEVAIQYGGSTVATATLPLAQLGITFGLDPKLFSDKKAPYCATFDPTTGALLTLDPLAE